MSMLSREQCLSLLEKYNVPEHIVRHSLAVEKVAVFIAEKFNEVGIPVNTGLVSRAALLHDLDKVETLKKCFGHLHGKKSREILEKEGFPELGKIVERHHLERVLSPKPFGCWEEKIVFYADKRVNNDKIVSLDERFDYLFKRYGKEKKVHGTILKCRPCVEALEKEIFAKINATPKLEELN